MVFDFGGFFLRRERKGFLVFCFMKLHHKMGYPTQKGQYFSNWDESQWQTKCQQQTQTSLYLLFVS